MAQHDTTTAAAATTADPLTEQRRHSSLSDDTQEAADTAAAAASTHSCREPMEDKQEEEAAEEDDEEEIDIAALKRQKVPLEPGFSQLHWMRYVRQAVRRPAKRYTLADIATHTDPTRSVWMAIRGQVYDVTAYLRYHPGGIPQLMKGAGKDCTKLFDKIHPYVNLEVMMAPLVIGTLVAEK